MVERLYRAWGRLMPRVHPCYAVKCNPDEGLLSVLAAMGAGFDCASEAEISQVRGRCRGDLDRLSSCLMRKSCSSAQLCMWLLHASCVPAAQGLVGCMLTCHNLHPCPPVQVLSLGVSPDRIVYAHPCKPPKQIRWSATHGVNLTTFDTESELQKVRGRTLCWCRAAEGGGSLADHGCSTWAQQVE